MQHCFRELSAQLPIKTLSEWSAGALIIAQVDHWGVGFRCEASLPHSGPLPMIHWLLAPYRDTPLAGIVEDCRSARLHSVQGIMPLAINAEPLGMAMELPPERYHRRNLLGDGKFMGLRCWDIPHDRHMVVTDLSNGKADITGADLINSWHTRWRISVHCEGFSLVLGDKIA